VLDNSGGPLPEIEGELVVSDNLPVAAFYRLGKRSNVAVRYRYDLDLGLPLPSVIEIERFVTISGTNHLFCSETFTVSEAREYRQAEDEQMFHPDFYFERGRHFSTIAADGRVPAFAAEHGSSGVGATVQGPNVLKELPSFTELPVEIPLNSERMNLTPRPETSPKSKRWIALTLFVVSLAGLMRFWLRKRMIRN
jgi:hypothetical protein